MVSHNVPSRPSSPLQQREGRYSAAPSTGKPWRYGMATSSGAELPISGAPPPIRSLPRYAHADGSVERRSLPAPLPARPDRSISPQPRSVSPQPRSVATFSEPSRSPDSRSDGTRYRNVYYAPAPALAGHQDTRSAEVVSGVAREATRSDAATSSSAPAAFTSAVAPPLAAASAVPAAATTMTYLAAAATPPVAALHTAGVSSASAAAAAAVCKSPLRENFTRTVPNASSMAYAIELRGELRHDIESLRSSLDAYQAQVRASLSNTSQLKDQQEIHKAQTEAALVEVCKSLTMQQQQLEQQEQCTGMIHQMLQESLPGAAGAVKRLQNEMERKQDGDKVDGDANLKEDKQQSAMAAGELLQQAQEEQQERQQQPLVQQQPQQLWRPFTAALKASIEHVAAQQEQLQQRTGRMEQALAQVQSNVNALREQVDEHRIQNTLRKHFQRPASSHRGDAAGGPRVEIADGSRLDQLPSPTVDESVLSQDVQALEDSSCQLGHSHQAIDSLSNNFVSRSSSVASLGPLRGELAAEVASLCQERFLGLEQKLRQEMEAMRLEVIESMTTSLRTELSSECEQQFQTLRGDTEAMHLEVRQQFAGMKTQCLQLMEAGQVSSPDRPLLDKCAMEDLRREQRTRVAELRRDLEKTCEQKLGALAEMGWALQREFEGMLGGLTKLESLQAQRQARQLELTGAASALRQAFDPHLSVPSQVDWQRLQEKHSEVCHIVAVQQSVHACQAAELDALRRAANARFLDVAKILRQSSSEPKNVGIGLWHEFHEKQMLLLQSVFEALQRMEFGQASELEGFREEMQAGLSKMASSLREEMEAMSTRVSQELDSAVMDAVRYRSEGCLESFCENAQTSNDDVQAAELSSLEATPQSLGPSPCRPVRRLEYEAESAAPEASELESNSALLDVQPSRAPERPCAVPAAAEPRTDALAPDEEKERTPRDVAELVLDSSGGCPKGEASRDLGHPDFQSLVTAQVVSSTDCTVQQLHQQDNEEQDAPRILPPVLPSDLDQFRGGGWRELREELNAAVLALPSIPRDPCEEPGYGALQGSVAQHRAAELHQEAAGLRVRLEDALQSLEEAAFGGSRCDVPATALSQSN